MLNLKDYMSIKDAAAYLGVSPGTMRNWGLGGKIATHRNPLNGYRLYKKSELEALLKTVDRPWKPGRRSAAAGQGR